MYFFAHLKDGHEICFVGDEAFRELSQMDPSADDLITKVAPLALFQVSCLTCSKACN